MSSSLGAGLTASAASDFVRVQIQRGGELVDRLSSLRNRLQDHLDRLGCVPAVVPERSGSIAPSPPKEPTLADVAYQLSNAVDALYEQLNRLQNT